MGLMKAGCRRLGEVGAVGRGGLRGGWGDRWGGWATRDWPGDAQGVPGV